MEIITNQLFESQLRSVLTYISKDSKNRAKKFNKALFLGIKSLDSFPYKFRKSAYFDDEHVKDYIFMGYTIPYLVDKDNNVIVILDIFKWRDK